MLAGGQIWVLNWMTTTTATKMSTTIMERQLLQWWQRLQRQQPWLKQQWKNINYGDNDDNCDNGDNNNDDDDNDDHGRDDSCNYNHDDKENNDYLVDGGNSINDENNNINNYDGDPKNQPDDEGDYSVIDNKTSSTISQAFSRNKRSRLDCFNFIYKIQILVCGFFKLSNHT